MTPWTIIGASSFTGRHFVEFLRARSALVHEISLRHPYGFAPQPGFVVNFAAMNIVAPSWERAEAYVDFNVRRFTALLDFLRERPPARYIHISTPEVYGSTAGWVNEDHPFNPSTPYAVTRAAQEMMLKVYGQQYGLDYCVTRACNVYGPGQQLWRLIPRLIYSVLAGKRFYLEGRGHSVRSFIHVDDMCQAIYAVAHEGKTGEAYHIAPLLSHSILGIVEMICGMLDVKMSEVCSDAPERPGKDAAYKLNSNKLRALNWTDQIDLDDGIIDVIDWMKQNWAEVQRMPLEWKP